MLLTGCLWLNGCQLYRAPSPIEAVTLPAYVNDVPDQSVYKMYKKLNDEGVKITTIGQVYRLSVPASLLFANQSPRITWQAYKVLNDIVCYVQFFRKISVHVNAFANCYGSLERTHVLTLARAKAVGNYLWEQNIASRMVFTEGLGNDKPIVDDSSCSDLSENARIEIVFRQLVA